MQLFVAIFASFQIELCQVMGLLSVDAAPYLNQAPYLDLRDPGDASRTRTALVAVPALVRRDGGGVGGEGEKRGHQLQATKR